MMPLGMPLPIPLPPLPGYGDDTVASFEEAARLRYQEATSLLARGYNSGAVYLFGYTVEAILKAAWFRLLGHGASQAIAAHDWTTANLLAQGYGLRLGQSGKSHSIAAWVRFLIVCHEAIAPYAPQRRIDLLSHVDLVHQFWTPEMRYKGEVISLGDAIRVQSAAWWVFSEYPRL